MEVKNSVHETMYLYVNSYTSQELNKNCRPPFTIASLFYSINIIIKLTYEQEIMIQ